MNPHAAEQTAVRLQRTISASPDRVYRAWLEPELLRRWMAPEGFEATRAEVDEQVGGRFRIWHARPDGDAGGFESEIIELVPDRRIVLRWGFVGTDRFADPALDSRLTITFESASEDSTLLTLVHERLEAISGAMPGMADSVATGWAMALDNLAALTADAT